MAEAERS